MTEPVATAAAARDAEPTVETPPLAMRLRRLVGGVHRRVHVGRTVHAIPFAVIGLLLARPHWPSGGEATLVILSVLFGRALAVAALRYFGAPDDVINPQVRHGGRTRDPLPRAIWMAFAIHAAMVFVFLAWMLNPLTGKLSIGAVGVLVLYATVRARTGAAHFLLGLGLGISPIGAFLALRGTIDADTLAPAAIGIGTMLWAAGFDMVFSLQPRLRDVGRPGAFERRMAFTPSTVAGVSRSCQAIAIGCFFAAWPLGHLKASYLIGPTLAATCLLISHLRVRSEAFDDVAGDFYGWNLLVGPSLLAGTILGI